MRFYTRRLALILLLCPLTGFAARPDGLPPPADAPPPPEYGPDLPSAQSPAPAQEPEVTIVERDNATFEEYRMNGRLYKIKVIPKVGPPYYLVDELGDNVWHRYDASGPPLHVPRWVILRF
ncbi:MAG: DUF2782 domain-containing protein [Betaproteobacteria bacterium]|nr:DUF2782 domain-containing protein [Betaproteobacteria bacterium]